MVKFSLAPALLLAVPNVVGGASASSSTTTTSQFNPIESLFSMFMPQQQATMSRNATFGTGKVLDPFAPTAEDQAAERQARKRRMRERNERVKEAFKNIQPKSVEKVSKEQLDKLDSPTLRKLGWRNGGNNGETSYFVDPGEDYDMWSQAYRMLGGYIDCDNNQGEGGSHDDGDGGEGGACSRWMMWAAVSFFFFFLCILWVQYLLLISFSLFEICENSIL